MSNYPTWNEFLGKYPIGSEDVFEALCRFLFRTRYGLGDSLPYFFNHAGIETAPITLGKDVIGFQSKFFSGNTIDDSQAKIIKDSIKTTHKHYPQLNKYIVYTNLAFGNPPAGKTITDRQKGIEDAAKSNSMTIEWMFGDNVLDAVAKIPFAYDLFFNLHSNTFKLPSAVCKYNERRFKNINTHIIFNQQEVRIKRKNYVSAIIENLAHQNNVLIVGESGSGKSAVVKQYWESIKDTEVVFYILNGGQFGTGSVNDLFRLDEDFAFSSFRDFFTGAEKKILFIDSAEKILEQSNHLVFQILTEELTEKGWQFIFTCKSSSADDMQTLLKEYSVRCSTIEIKELKEEELSALEKEYQIPKPGNEKIQKQILTPFYLARYCELDIHNMDTPKAFRDLVWKRKVRGLAIGPEQQKREECLLKIVRAQQVQGTYHIIMPDIEHTAAYALETEDILINDGYKGYAIKHDIYTDWALEYIIERDFDTNEHGLAVLFEAPQSLTYQNAFKRWLQLIIDSEDDRVNAIVEAFVTGKINERWESAILSCIGLSSGYSSTFFAKYDAELKAGKFSLFNRFVDFLHVSCQYIVSYFEFKGDKYPIMRPNGSGWHDAVRFIYDNKSEYYMGHTNAVYKVLQDYSGLGWEAKERRNAALLSLYIFDKVADTRKKGEHFWLDNPKPWCSLVCTYAPAIYKELEERFQEVLDNHWVNHTDPYAELVAFILRDSEYITTTYPVCLACTKHIVKLMDLLWREMPETEEERSLPFRSVHENDYNYDYWFGLNKKFDNGLSYFPSSGFQTPIYPLFVAESKYFKEELPVLKFVIRFVDDCVECFSKRRRDFHEPVEEINIKLKNGENQRILANHGLWNLYRGTSGISVPHLIESIHMALETFLLDQITDSNEENKQTHKYAHQLLWYILEHSHSVSLYSVVASVAMAAPREFFDVLLAVCGDIRFLSYDITRYSSEQTAGFMTGGLPTHEHMYEERKKSNARSHRKYHLEQALLFRQIEDASHDDEESQERLRKVYSVVDALKEQVDKMDGVPSTYLFILARVDYRTMKKESIKLENGVEAMQYTPSLTKELQAESDAMANNKEWMRGVNLNVWTDKMFEGDETAIEKLRYGEDVQQVLADIRTIEKQFKEKSPQLFALHGDEYIPYKASAVLLLKKYELLTDDERLECWNRVMDALQSPRFLISHSLTGINICLNTIPVMMNMKPDRLNDFSKIIAIYSGVREEYVNTRICDIMSYVIERSALWEKYPAVMEDALNCIREGIADKDFYKMNTNQANAVLCLITPQTEFRNLLRTCIHMIAQLWEPKPHHDILDRTYQDSNLVARFVLNAPKQEVAELIAPYTDLMDTEHDYETLLSSILIYTVNNDKYDNFWIIWDLFFDPLTKTVRYYYNGQMLNTYLLNPHYLTMVVPNWFKLEEKDLAFFEKVIEVIPRHPAVLNATSKVFSTIGKKYVKQAIGMFAYIANAIGKNIELKDSKDAVITNLEKIINHAYSEYENELTRNVKLRNQLIDLLDFMITNGSQTASFMREKL